MCVAQAGWPQSDDCQSVSPARARAHTRRPTVLVRKPSSPLHSRITPLATGVPFGVARARRRGARTCACQDRRVGARGVCRGGGVATPSSWRQLRARGGGTIPPSSPGCAAVAVATHWWWPENTHGGCWQGGAAADVGCRSAPPTRTVVGVSTVPRCKPAPAASTPPPTRPFHPPAAVPQAPVLPPRGAVAVTSTVPPPVRRHHSCHRAGCGRGVTARHSVTSARAHTATRAVTAARRRTSFFVSHPCVGAGCRASVRAHTVLAC